MRQYYIMLEWYNNYSIPLEINDDNIEIYVNLLLKNNNLISNDENIIENKVNQIEIDYEIKFKKLEEICYDQDEINKFLDKNSLLILQKEL